ncbi:putative protein FAM47C [Merluccius polli]|uniref:Uncharacterized protein n=1 Tax=Merluccius polli TaxID=89951 RepID=A0AA47PA51_MERPO|nr:putative protein FAM47C [Merluccius polli]
MGSSDEAIGKLLFRMTYAGRLTVGTVERPNHPAAISLRLIPGRLSARRRKIAPLLVSDRGGPSGEYGSSPYKSNPKRPWDPPVLLARRPWDPPPVLLARRPWDPPVVLARRSRDPPPVVLARRPWDPPPVVLARRPWDPPPVLLAGGHGIHLSSSPGGHGIPTCPPRPAAMGSTCPPRPAAMGSTTCPPRPAAMGSTTCRPRPAAMGSTTCRPRPAAMGSTCPPRRRPWDPPLSSSPGGHGIHHLSSSPGGHGIHLSSSPGGHGIHHLSSSPGGHGIHHLSSSPGGHGIHHLSSSPGGHGIHLSSSPGGHGIHHLSSSPGGHGIHLSSSPGGHGIHHLSSSPGGHGIHHLSSSPGGHGIHHLSSSPGGHGIHLSSSPGGHGIHHLSSSPGGHGIHHLSSSPGPAPAKADAEGGDLEFAVEPDRQRPVAEDCRSQNVWLSPSFLPSQTTAISPDFNSRRPLPSDQRKLAPPPGPRSLLDIVTHAHKSQRDAQPGAPGSFLLSVRDEADRREGSAPPHRHGGAVHRHEPDARFETHVSGRPPWPAPPPPSGKGVTLGRPSTGPEWTVEHCSTAPGPPAVPDKTAGIQQVLYEMCIG